jgi:hypothetical protein
MFFIPVSPLSCFKHDGCRPIPKQTFPGSKDSAAKSEERQDAEVSLEEASSQQQYSFSVPFKCGLTAYL